MKEKQLFEQSIIPDHIIHVLKYLYVLLNYRKKRKNQLLLIILLIL